MKIFQFLKELTALITPNQIKNPKQITGNVKRLYDTLRRNDINTESKLLKELEFQTPYYWKLSGQLKERLFHLLFFIRLDTEIRNVYIKVYLQFAIIKILSGLGARMLVVKLAEETVQLAINYEMIEVVYFLCRLLRYDFAALSGNRKKFEKYAEIVEEYRNIMIAEDIVELLLSEVLIHFAKSKATNEEVRKLVKKNLQSLEPYKKVESFRFRLFYYNLLAKEKELAYDDFGLIEVCDQSITFFRNKPQQTPNATIFSFLFKKIPAQIHLKQFENTKETIDYGLSTVHPYDHNWYVVQQYHIIWCFHSQNYQTAWEILKEVRQQKRKPDKSVLEAWKIYEAFIYYFIAMGEIEADDDSEFNIFKFLNSVPIFSKDKIGFNVAIKIVEFLFLLKLGDKGRHKIIDQAKSLEEYNRNHLSRRKDVVRSYIFIKMLLQFPRGSFRKAVVEYKAKKYHKMLLDNALNVSRQVKELEIVPYEVLWDLALKCI